MFLNRDEILTEIRNNSLIINHDSRMIDNASYKCRIGKILLPGKRKKKITVIEDDTIFKLRPSEIVIIETLERINTPSHFGCIYSILNSRAKDGLLLINASIIEPGYSGKLSCYLVNISQNNLILFKGQEIAKLVIFRTQSTINLNQNNIADIDYIRNLKIQASHFGRTFLDINKLQNNAAQKATKKVNRSLTFGGIFLALLLTFAALQPIIDKFVVKRFFESEKVETNLIKSFLELEEDNIELKKSITKNKELLDSLIKENEEDSLSHN